MTREPCPGLWSNGKVTVVLANVSYVLWGYVSHWTMGTALDNENPTEFSSAHSLIVDTPGRKFAIPKEDGVDLLRALSLYWETRV